MKMYGPDYKKMNSQKKPYPKKLRPRIDRLNAAVRDLKEKLRHSAALNRAVFEHAPVGISVRLGSGRLLSVNRAWKKIWKLSNRQIRDNERISRRWTLKQRYPYLKDATPKVRRIFERGGELFLPELKVGVPRPGIPKWISQYYYAIQDKRGRVGHIVTMTQDITAQKAAALALRESEEKFRTIVHNVNIGVYRTTGDFEGRFLQINPAFAKMFGYDSVKQVMNKRVQDLYQNFKDRRGFIKELMKKGLVRNKELRLQKKDGTPIWVSVYAKAQADENGKVKWIDGVIQDITERKHIEERLRVISLVDDLTGLYNRRGFLALAEHQLKVASRAKKGVLLLFIDLDNLKEVNDEFGHPIGDRALLQTTDILKKTFRESDIIARIGGDEFVVLTLETTGASAQTFCGRLQRSLDSFNKFARLPFALALSIGWAHYDPARPITIRKMLALADRMMYRHKLSKKTAPRKGS
jgi:diguanylate cyclase (GGDEF)-like protein/PAS domain S-box-containing protein